MASTTPVPTTEREKSRAGEYQPSSVTDAQWTAMQKLLNQVYDHRTPDGHDTSKVFHRKVNKRVLPEYYQVIQEPIALSTIKAKINTREYTKFAQYVRDFALISHNAQVYNRPDAGAYQDALDIKELAQSELKKLVDAKIVSIEEATMPYLGEIPPQDELPPLELEQDEEENEEEEEDDEGEESDDSRAVKPRGRGRPPGSKTKRDQGKDEATRAAEIEAKKKMGRPPRVDTPMEQRMKNVMKGLRRPKDDGQLKIAHFYRLPDKSALPDYYNEIKNPVAMDVLKKKINRKKYQSFADFMRDVEQMFENAKLYNTDESKIYQDAVDLQIEARRIYQEEAVRPDTDFPMEDGRIPLPQGITHNGEVWKVGDWVHVQNPNDLTKPIVTQIFRTWQDSAGNKSINVCWYYRPEQTVHRFDRRFLENEVVKTGQYRDHQIDEIVDRCFVMFVTRYSRGRPRHFPHDKEIYVCESRYNDDRHTFNKIKTWASCLPDEVRDKDYEMEMYKVPLRMNKGPSPIAYLLKNEQKESDDLPKPQWGSDNAPPKIGAVHRRPRDPKDSPPLDLTTNLPRTETFPTTPQIPQRLPSEMNNQMSQGYGQTRAPDLSRTISTSQGATASSSQLNSNLRPQPAYQSNGSSISTPRYQNNSQTYNTNATHSDYHSRLAQANATAYGTRGVAPNASHLAASYSTPQPVEVWHLHESANASIPPDVRNQFQCDQFGHVLFFTSPPVEVKVPEKQGAVLGHSARYMAAKLKRDVLVKEKRKADEAARQEREVKRRKHEEIEQEDVAKKASIMEANALRTFQQQLEKATVAEFQDLYKDSWKECMARDMEVRLA